MDIQSRVKPSGPNAPEWSCGVLGDANDVSIRLKNTLPEFFDSQSGGKAVQCRFESCQDQITEARAVPVVGHRAGVVPGSPGGGRPAGGNNDLLAMHVL